MMHPKGKVVTLLLCYKRKYSNWNRLLEHSFMLREPNPHGGSISSGEHGEVCLFTKLLKGLLGKLTTYHEAKIKAVLF